MSKVVPGAPELYPPEAAVHDAVARALAEDVKAGGDLSAQLVDEAARARLVIAAREPGVIAGQRCAEAAFHSLDPELTVTWERPDGSEVAPGDVVASVEGTLRSMLTAERTALNFLGHLSGIASLTRRFVDAVEAVDKKVGILDTRKTTPGLRVLEKAAVRAGGGRNHRSSLSEAVLVKDNHLSALSITEAVREARRRWPATTVEIECDTAEQVVEACTAGADAVLLDNMSPEEAKECVKITRTIAGGAVRVEASGGMTLETVPRYAAAGVDVISVGALTHSVPVLDLGLDLAPL